MTQYIDKVALVAEIKRRIDRDNEKAAYYSSSSEHDYLYRVKEAVYKDLLHFLDTLEVKEIDLEKEIKRFTMSKELYESDSVIKAVAEHFFELGINTRKI